MTIPDLQADVLEDSAIQPAPPEATELARIIGGAIEKRVSEIVSMPTEDHQAYLAQQVQHLPTYRKLALKVAEDVPYAFVDEGGGNLYLQGSAAEHIAGILGIGLIPTPSPVEVGLEGGHVRYDWPVLAVWPRFGAVVTQVGTRSTTDKFFAHLFRDGEDWEKGKSFVRKAALSNAYSRAVSRMLGLSGIDVDALAALGFPMDKLKSVERREGSRGGKTTGEKQSEDIKAMADALKRDMVAFLGDEEKALELVRKFTRYERDGKTYHNTFATMKFDWQVKKAREEWEKWQKENPSGALL